MLLASYSGAGALLATALTASSSTLSDWLRSSIINEAARGRCGLSNFKLETDTASGASGMSDEDDRAWVGLDWYRGVKAARAMAEPDVN